MKDYENCYNCGAKKNCSAAVGFGSIMCTINRMQSGQSKADFIGTHRKAETRYCAYCGKPLRVIGSERFCNNVQCTNRYVNV